jgi:hypothetical protein
MAVFEIYFHGLICFYAPESRYGTRDYKTEALIVKDEAHTRLLLTPNGYKHEFNNNLSFEIAPGRANAEDSRFQRFVAHLGDVEVTRESVIVEPANRACIALKLPDGSRLRAAELYDMAGEFQLDGNIARHPVCRVSALHVYTASEKSLLITADKQTIEVEAAEPWAVVFNGSRNDHSESCSDNHFRHYAFITNSMQLDDIAEVTNHAPDIPSAPAGVHVAKAIKAILDGAMQTEARPMTQTQCSNSQWP